MCGKTVRENTVRTAGCVMVVLWCVVLTWFGTCSAVAETSCQPDLQIACKGGEYVGQGVYTTDSDSQSVTGLARARAALEYCIAIQNDGDVRDCFVVREREGVTHSKWIRRYFDAEEGGNDITESICGDGWATPVLGSGASNVIRLCVVPGAGTDRQDIELVATSALTEGDLNLTPDTSEALRFEMTTPQGVIDIDTLHDNMAGYTYSGPVTVVKIVPKAQGRTLQYDGHSLLLEDSIRYVLTSGSMTVELRNLQPDAKNWNQAKGHWWLKVSAAVVGLEPHPVEAETVPADVVGISSQMPSTARPVRVKRWKEVQ